MGVESVCGGGVVGFWGGGKGGVAWPFWSRKLNPHQPPYSYSSFLSLLLSLLLLPLFKPLPLPPHHHTTQIISPTHPPFCVFVFVPPVFRVCFFRVVFLFLCFFRIPSQDAVVDLAPSSVYSLVTEEQYASLVSSRRSREDFVVDDGGLGYHDDGEEFVDGGGGGKEGEEGGGG